MTKSFSELGLPKGALKAVSDLAYENPTPVQEQAIPAVLQGRDVIAAAKTGTGKTAAFCLPTISTLPNKRPGLGPTMLVLTPTRELAMQIDEVADTIAKRCGKKVTSVVGGVSYNPQISALSQGVDVLVATPGRLIDLLGQNALTLEHVKVLVMDEADRMLDMGFLPDVKRIVKHCPAGDERQTLLFSATIDKNIQNNLLDLLTDPVFVEIAHKGETADLVQEYQIKVAQRAKHELLLAVLQQFGWERVIVFCRTKYRVDTCCRKLRAAKYTAAPIHGGRSQNQRKNALERFAKGEVDILVATDILARGIDISEVPYIVNFDLPHDPEDYVHRIGRTGRAGEKGLAISFVTPGDAQDLKGIVKLIGHDIPVIEAERFDSTQSDQAMADQATRKAARTDPEIDAVMREMKKVRKKHEKKAREAAEKEMRETAPEERSGSTKAAKPHNTRKRRKGKQGKPSGHGQSPHAQSGRRSSTKSPSGHRNDGQGAPHSKGNAQGRKAHAGKNYRKQQQRRANGKQGHKTQGRGTASRGTNRSHASGKQARRH